MRRIHYTLPFLLMTLALAGCGSGGGDGMSSAGSTTTPTVTRGGNGPPDQPSVVQESTPVEAAENEYTVAVQAVANLADDASDAVRLGAEENVLVAANAYLEALEDADAVHSEVTRVEGLVISAAGSPERDADADRRRCGPCPAQGSNRSGSQSVPESR